MATVADLLQSFRRECGDKPPDVVLSLDWLQGRYAEVLERVPWQFLVKEGTITTAAGISAGTVTMTAGSATVTETTSNANGWTSAVANRFFRRRGDTEYYGISSFGDANPDTLTLDRAYEGATATLQNYDIWTRYYSLASDVRHVVDMFTGSERVMQLQEVSQFDIDTAYANRPDLGSARHWTYAGVDSSNNRRVEFYPAPDTAYAIYYRYIQATPSLANGSTAILPQVNQSLLRAGWLADFWSWRGAFSDASPLYVAHADRYEAEFSKRLQEMIARECLALSPKRIRFASNQVKHRLRGKFEIGRGVLLP